MIRVANRRCIRSLALKSLRAATSRNLIAVLAITLTTLLFTSLFTIAGTMADSFQQQTFRQAGGDMHGTFKNISWEQVELLEKDPLIAKSAARLLVGMPSEPPFNKNHVEVSYMDENCASGSFCTPTTGSLPKEGTDQIACDTLILKLLGVEPKIGAKVRLTYDVGLGRADPTRISETYTLCGWWEYDPAVSASMALVPRSCAERILADYEPCGSADATGTWDLNIYLRSDLHMKEDLLTILTDNGLQGTDAAKDNYVGVGVNWAYLSAQYAGTADLQTVAALAAVLLLIVLTGYLIINNIFQISVANDIRFYGLLKTIGATGRQLRGLIRRQALSLSAAGIPLGLLLGWLTGRLLSPVVMSTLSLTHTVHSANPLIFAGAALFSLVTVLISCARPGRMAARVSPVEAVRWTESSGGKKRRKSRSGGSALRMALANLGRSKKRTVLVILSLSLAVALLETTCTFASGFDLEKYVSYFNVSDFLLGSANYIHGNALFSAEEAVPEEAVAAVNAQCPIEAGGRIYGLGGGAEEFITEDWFRQKWSRWNSADTVEQLLSGRNRTADGLVEESVQLYGMEDFPLEKLNVLEGDLAPLRDPAQNAIAAVYDADDYGKLKDGSNWAVLGDKVTVRYVEEWEYLDLSTGEKIDDLEQHEGGYVTRSAKYRDVTYTVAALVTVSHAMSYRYFGDDEFILGSEVFCRDSESQNILSYLFDLDDASTGKMEVFLKDYTENADPTLDYESRESYASEFYGFRNMFLLMGGALSFVVGLIGILNFLNAILTSILARRRELAMLQSIGMTGRQLKAMLVWEGLLYTLIAGALSLALSVALGPVLGDVVGKLMWFFTYRFTILPVAAAIPVYALLGVVLPLLAYRALSRQTIVERLREAE